MHARTETPDAAATIEQRVEADRLIASERLEAEVRIERRFGRSTTGGCGIDASAGREHIGAMREQIDRQILWQWQHGIERQLRRSEEHTSELQSLMRISYAVFCLKKNTRINY